MRLNIDRDLVKQMVSGQLPNKSRHLDELTYELTIWSCDTGQWLSCFDSCQLTKLWMSNIQDLNLQTHLRHPSLPFDNLPYPTLTICRRVRTLGQSRDNQNKRDWRYSMSMGLRLGAPLYMGASLLAMAKSIYYGVNRLLIIFRSAAKSFQICMCRPGLRDYQFVIMRTFIGLRRTVKQRLKTLFFKII